MKRIMFCPYRGCQAHFEPPDHPWFVRCGTYCSNRSGKTQRYRCKCCARYFSDSSFSLDYFAKRRVDYSRVLKLVCSCTGIRQMSRILGVHRQTVSNRIMRLSRQAMSVHCQLTIEMGLTEAVVIDGLVSYWVSQYVPNEFTVIIGSPSRFLYAFNACSKRRSGRMRDAQRRRREQIELRFRADPSALYHSVSSLIDDVTRMADQTDRQLHLSTDEHHTYTRVLSEHPGWVRRSTGGKAVHIQVSSHRTRNRSNPLAPANTLDRSIRSDLAEHTRETIRFARSLSASTERFVCYQHWHNYRKPAAINEASHDRRTHAEQAGIDPHHLRRALAGFYSRRRFLSHTPLWGAMRDLWLRVEPTPLKLGSEYLPRYLLE